MKYKLFGIMYLSNWVLFYTSSPFGLWIRPNCLSLSRPTLPLSCSGTHTKADSLVPKSKFKFARLLPIMLTRFAILPCTFTTLQAACGSNTIVMIAKTILKGGNTINRTASNHSYSHQYFLFEWLFFVILLLLLLSMSQTAVVS